MPGCVVELWSLVWKGFWQGLLTGSFLEKVSYWPGWIEAGREEGVPESTGVKAEKCSRVWIAVRGDRSDHRVACYGGSRMGSIGQGHD